MGKPIIIGKIVNTHGLRGEIKITPMCDDPEIYNELDSLLIDNNEYFITKSRIHKNIIILKLENIDDIDTAESFRNKLIYIDRDLLGELPDGVYFIEDLLNIDVVTEDGKSLGYITEIIQTGSNDVYVLKNDKSTILLPAIKGVILETDIENKKMTVCPPDGLPGLYDS